MLPSERLPYSGIETRPKLALPDGIRMIVWPVLALENWDISRPMARVVVSPPQGQPLIPDHPNWSWHEYGMRVGFWRLKRMFERLGASPTVTLNARCCETYPEVIRACADMGWELSAHGWDQQPMHTLDDQRGSIRKAVETIRNFSGQAPRGWFGPGLTETYETLDYLSEAGIDYIGDWVADDEPVTLATEHRPIVAMPYNFEVHDLALYALQHHASDMIHVRGMDYFDCLYAESEERPKFMSISLHAYLSGSPHRVAHVERLFRDVMMRPGVACWDGATILDWYRGQAAG